MNTSPRFGEITQDFGDGTYVFRLTLGGIRELQDKAKCGAPEILLRLMFKKWWIDDVREIIRLGLIGGGGVKPVDALKLIDRYVDQRPYYESLPLAQKILSEVLLPPAAQKKSEAESEEKDEAPMTEVEAMELLTSFASMATEPSLDSLLPKSTI